MFINVDVIFIMIEMTERVRMFLLLRQQVLNVLYQEQNQLLHLPTVIQTANHSCASGDMRQ